VERAGRSRREAARVFVTAIDHGYPLGAVIEREPAAAM
jgi:hypothetical protein